MPNYNSGITYAYKSSDDVNTQRYVAISDCYIQGLSRTQAKAGTPFVRLIIDDVTVYEGQGSFAKYNYVWSPLFFVKKGSTVVYTISNGSEATDGVNALCIYKTQNV